MKRRILAAVIAPLFALGVAACDVDTQGDTELPDVDVQGGELPEDVDVETPNVDVEGDIDVNVTEDTIGGDVPEGGSL